jgi:hypothetical protein
LSTEAPAASTRVRGPLVWSFVPGIIAGIITLFLGGRAVVSGVNGAGAATRAVMPGTVLIMGVLMVLGFAALVVIGHEPAFRVGGLVLGTLATVVIVAPVISARVSERFAKDSSVTLLGGGKLAIAAGVLSMLTAIIAGLFPAWPPAKPGTANIALICAALGLLVPPLGAIGLGLGRQSRQDPDTQMSRRAVAAVVLGLTALISWLVLLVAEALLAGR